MTPGSVPRWGPVVLSHTRGCYGNYSFSTSRRLKSVRSTELLSPTAVMHATVASSSALVSSTRSLTVRKKKLPDLDRIAPFGLADAAVFPDRVAALIQTANKAAICRWSWWASNTPRKHLLIRSVLGKMGSSYGIRGWLQSVFHRKTPKAFLTINTD